EHLIEKLADHDEVIAEKFLDGKTIDVADLRAAIRRATIAMKVTPVLCGAAQRCKGIQPLLDSVCDFLPSPLDLPPVKGKVPRSKRQSAGEELEEGALPEDWGEGERKPDPAAPFCALAFKTHSSPHGELCFMRIYSGTVDGAEQVLNIRKGKRER